MLFLTLLINTGSSQTQHNQYAKSALKMPLLQNCQHKQLGIWLTFIPQKVATFTKVCTSSDCTETFHSEHHSTRRCLPREILFPHSKPLPQSGGSISSRHHKRMYFRNIMLVLKYETLSNDDEKEEGTPTVAPLTGMHKSV